MLKRRYGLLVVMSITMIAGAEGDDISEGDSSAEYASHDNSSVNNIEDHEEHMSVPEKVQTDGGAYTPAETHPSEEIHTPFTIQQEPLVPSPSSALGTIDTPESSTTTDGWKVHGVVHQSEFRGNWLKKRLIRKNASALYEKIHESVSRDWEKQYKDFGDALGETLKAMNQRRQAIYLNEADIAYVQEHMDQVIRYKVDQAKLKASATKMAPVTYDQAAYNAQLEELREALKALDEPKSAAEQVAATVQQQMPLGAMYEQQAWQQYEEIDVAYDDRHAEEIFLQMEAAYEHMQEMLRYVQSELTPYTQRLATLFDERLLKLQSIRDAVLKEGIPLRPSEVEALKPVAAPEKVKSTSWTQQALEYVKSPFIWLWSKAQGLIS